MLTPTPTTPDLRPREVSASADPTDSDGNLICPTEAVTCPLCPEGQECYQQARTPTTCAKYVCVDKESDSLSSVSVGGIVGGVIGGLVALAAIALAYYFFVYRKRHPPLSDDVAMSEMDTGSQVTGDATLGEKLERPVARRVGLANSVTKQHRLLAYDSFMRPQARYNKRNGPGSARTVRTDLSPYGDSDMTKRNSMATTISTTNASNILPVAYIPGVTIRPTKNNTRSLYLYESELIFSDMNAIENASIVADRNQKGTMTAIRAQPRLVNVARIEEEDENGNENENENEDASGSGNGVENGNQNQNQNQNGSGHENQNGVPNDNGENSAWTWPKDLSENTVLYTVNTTVEADSDVDSDVDSDIVEIGRATSTRRPRDVESEEDQKSGSFILNIEGPE